QVHELQAAVLAAHGGVAPDDLAQAGGVHVGHVRQVQQDLGLAAVHQPRHRVAQGVVALADQDLAVEVQHDHVTDLALDNLHGGVLQSGASSCEERSPYHTVFRAVNATASVTNHRPCASVTVPWTSW